MLRGDALYIISNASKLCIMNVEINELNLMCSYYFSIKIRFGLVRSGLGTVRYVMELNKNGRDWHQHSRKGFYTFYLYFILDFYLFLAFKLSELLSTKRIFIISLNYVKVIFTWGPSCMACRVILNDNSGIVCLVTSSLFLFVLSRVNTQQA